MPFSATGPSFESSDAQRLKLLIDAISDYAICMLDPNGFVTSWNSGAQRIKGYRAVEIIGQHFSRFFTREDQVDGLPARILEQARITGRFENEGWRLRKDGSRFWASVIVQPVYDSGGHLLGFAKITRDVTERMAAQEALLQSERRFRMFVEGVTDYAIYMLDPSGVVTDWNLGAERMKGYTAEEIIGHHVSRFYTSEDRAAGIPARVLDSAAREGTYESEGWRVRKDGSHFWASVVVDAIRNDAGELLGFAKITRDITEREAAQEALRESEQQFRQMIESVTDYAIFMLDPNGIVTSWNSGAERIKGYTADEIIGHHFSRFYTESDRASGLPSRALHTAAEQGRFESEGWRLRKEGTLFWASVVIDSIKGEDGNVVGYAKITRDLTERRKILLALQESNAQRAHSQKMDALGQLTGGVAHDFNNLLMIVSGHVQTIKKLVAQDPKGLRSVDAIELAAKRGAALTRQLLTFSRRQAINPEIVHIGERIDAIQVMLASAIGGTVKLVTNVLPDTWPVKVDVGEFELALVNTALNARDAMVQGGVITINVENVRLRPQDTIQRLEGDFVAITITDTGCGIAPDILSKVFDPFFTTKKTAQGTGLGLSQVHGFAHQSGGTVAIESDLGKGTKVTLYLRRADSAPEQAITEIPVASPGGSVLLVEDNPDVAVVSATMLEELGYTVETVDNARAALNVLDAHKFDLVVSDIVMAGEMDGLGLARALRANHPDLAILLVTGYSNAASNAGNEFAVLRKPFQLADLSRAAAKVIAESKQPQPANLVQLHDARRGAHSRNEQR